MSFKKYFPWLAGLLIIVLAGAALMLTRGWTFGRQIGLRGLPDEGSRRVGPMMGWGGGHMSGIGVGGGLWMFIGPLFTALLFLFTVWALIKIVQTSLAQMQGSNLIGGRTCPNCGRPTAAEWNHCPACGTNLRQPPPPPVDPVA